MALTILLLWIAVVGWRALADVRALARRPAGPVYRLFLARAVAAATAALGVAAAPAWVMLWPHLGISSPPKSAANPLGIPLSLLLPAVAAMTVAFAGTVGALAATHFIHGRRLFSSLAPYAPRDHFR